MESLGAMYRAVVTSPDDDLARLVYADYVEEFGGEEGVLRAEHIRTQVEVARLLAQNPQDKDPRLVELEERDRRLTIMGYALGWFVAGPWLPIDPECRPKNTGGWHVFTHRGFPSMVRTHVRAWVDFDTGNATQLAADLTRLLPISAVSFTDRRPRPVRHQRLTDFRTSRTSRGTYNIQQEFATTTIWAWDSRPPQSEPTRSYSHLPASVFARLRPDGQPLRSASEPLLCVYPTEREARDDASAALLALVREGTDE